MNISINSLCVCVRVRTHLATTSTQCGCCDAATVASDNRKYHYWYNGCAMCGNGSFVRSFVVARFNLWMHNCYLNSLKFWYIDASGLPLFALESGRANRFESESVENSTFQYIYTPTHTRTRYKVHNTNNIIIVENLFRCSVSSGVPGNCLAWKWILPTLLPLLPIQNARKSIPRLNHIEHKHIKVSNNSHIPLTFLHFKNVCRTITNVTNTTNRILMKN